MEIADIPKAAILELYCRRAEKRSATPHPAGIAGIAKVRRGHYKSFLLNWLRSYEGETTELVCHPGEVDQELLNYDEWHEMRVEELQALTSREVLDIIRARSIELVSIP